MVHKKEALYKLIAKASSSSSSSPIPILPYRILYSSAKKEASPQDIDRAIEGLRKELNAQRTNGDGSRIRTTRNAVSTSFSPSSPPLIDYVAMNKWIIKPAQSSGCGKGLKVCGDSKAIYQNLQHKDFAWSEKRILQPYLHLFETSEYRVYFTGDGGSSSSAFSSNEPMMVYTPWINKGLAVIFIPSGHMYNETIDLENGKVLAPETNTWTGTHEMSHVHNHIVQFPRRVMVALSAVKDTDAFQTILGRVDMVCLHQTIWPPNPASILMRLTISLVLAFLLTPSNQVRITLSFTLQ